MSLKFLPKKLEKHSSPRTSRENEILPQEIFLLILEYVCDSFGLSEVERAEQTIYGFPVLRVCRFWHLIGLRYLYTSIAPRTTASYRLLLRTLDHSKDIPPLIRSLVFPMDHNIFNSYARNRVIETPAMLPHHALIEEIVRKCPELTHLRIPFDGWYKYFPGWRIAGPGHMWDRYFPGRRIASPNHMSALTRLTHLHVAAFNFFYQTPRAASYNKIIEWFSQVDILPNLEYFTVSDVIMNLTFDIPTKWPAMPRLHTLSLERTGFLPAGVPSLLLQTAPTLKALRFSGKFDRPERREVFSISGFLECTMQSIEVVAAAIEDLYIVCPSFYYGRHFSFENWDKKHLPNLMNTKHLHISACLLNDKILGSLPNKMETLTIEFSETEELYHVYGPVRQTLKMDHLFSALPLSVRQIIFWMESETTLEGWEIIERQAIVDCEAEKFKALENSYFKGNSHALSSRAYVVQQQVYELARQWGIRLRLHLELPIPLVYTK
ncbi:hypothetical protein M422DRAFT_52876 [Sphaerobolus stellatus SS14]|uniref:Uncharacterized protein n=1 Tax=Sphaerobolus stellatus (strain SS14) TaxID=990650 RepID=A0A0C9V4S1_SPHS4|nr:hypothetical protein M422DRAFT_52876 [Sphaerobolus stellatus SS14]